MLPAPKQVRISLRQRNLMDKCVLIGILHILVIPSCRAFDKTVELVDPNPQYASFFGIHSTAVPDISGDSIPDIAIGTRGSVVLFDGASGMHLGTIDSIDGATPSNIAFPAGIAGLRDINGNGCGEILAASVSSVPKSPGRVFVFDGRTREVLFEMRSPKPEKTDFFGSQLYVLSDVNQDGNEDFLISEHGRDLVEDGSAPSTGAAHVFNGSTGELLYSLLPPDPKILTRFGGSLTGVPDVNGDGIDDIAIGNPRWPESHINIGKVFVYDGLSGAFLYSIESPNARSDGRFGESLCSLNDINGNGSGEIVVGTDLEKNVYVYDGGTMEVLQLFELSEFASVHVWDSCDVDADGSDEILVSDILVDNPPLANSGVVLVLDPMTGEIESVLDSPNPAQVGRFGSSLSCVLDGDGGTARGVVIGAYSEERSGNPENSGRAYFFLLNDNPFEGNSDINQDGVIDYLDLMILLEDWKKVSGP